MRLVEAEAAADATSEGLAETTEEVAAATERREVHGQEEVAELRLEAMRRAMSRESPECSGKAISGVQYRDT